ncbi:FAD-dependent oxidoreductase [Candidatus Gracilibacteria bacterium]|nr:FAD-dependent oxidoreductase [Candidatus Gracilibacteria bacterium]
MNAPKKKIAVVGAGISGLTCAYELQKAGFDVVVYEKNERVGGRMASRTKDGFVFDIGADHLCNLYTHMKVYCAEFGIQWEPMRFLKYGVAKQGKIVSMDDAIGFFSRLRLAFQYFRTNKMGDIFDLGELAVHDNPHENGYDFMVKRIGKEASDYLVDAYSTTYQFHRATEISKGALMGILYSVKTSLGGWALQRTQGGMQALPDAFAARLNVQCGHAVLNVTADADGCSVDGERFDAVVMASTANMTDVIYTNPTAAQKQLLQKARYAASISVAFRVPRELLPKIAVVWVPFVESSMISGMVNESMKGEELTTETDTLLCTWLHEDFARSIMDKTDEEIFAIIKPELLRVCPWFSNEHQLHGHDLQRWHQAMPKFYPGYLAEVKNFVANNQGDQNVFFCGDYMNLLWTEGSLRGGQRTAAQVVRKLAA